MLARSSHKQRGMLDMKCTVVAVVKIAGAAHAQCTRVWLRNAIRAC
jgi:hypothetical protein